MGFASLNKVAEVEYLAFGMQNECRLAHFLPLFPFDSSYPWWWAKHSVTCIVINLESKHILLDRDTYLGKCTLQVLPFYGILFFLHANYVSWSTRMYFFRSKFSYHLSRFCVALTTNFVVNENEVLASPNFLLPVWLSLTHF